MMWPALAWIAWRVGGTGEAGSSAAAAALVVATLGFAGYCAYIYGLTGQPLLWATALTRWGGGYHPGGAPWTAPVDLLRRLLTHPYVFLASGRWRSTTRCTRDGAAFAATIPFVWQRFGAAYGLFMLVNLYVPLSSGAFEGLGPLLLGPVSGVHLARIDPVAVRLHVARRGVRALLHARPRAVHDGPSAFLNSEGLRA